MPCLAFEVIVCNFNVAKSMYQGPVSISECRYLLLQGILRRIRFAFRFLVLSL